MAKKETALSVLKEIRSYLERRWPFEPVDKRPYKVTAGSRFIKNDDDTITDLSTGLVWGPMFANEMKHGAAEQACKELRIGGYKDWRLPTVKELISLVDYEKHNPTIDIKFFPDTKSSWYWTSTLCAGDPDYAWIVNFYYGDINTNYKYNSYYVRPVRSSK